MHMSIWWDYKIIDYLFKGFTAHSIPGLIAMCVCVAAMSFLFEFLRYLQAKQRQKELILRSEQLKTICPTETSTLLAESASAAPQVINITLIDRALLCGAEISLWFVLQNLGYILMLSIMIFNGWLFVSSVLGGGFGYFIFGQMFMKINLENCQIIRDTWCMQKCGEPELYGGSKDGESTPALETADTSSSVFNCHEVRASVHAQCHT